MAPVPKASSLALTVPSQLAALATQVGPTIASQAPTIAGAARLGASANLLRIAAAPARPGTPVAGLLTAASAAVAHKTIEAASSAAIGAYAARFAEQGRRIAASSPALALSKGGPIGSLPGTPAAPGALFTPPSRPQRPSSGGDRSQGTDSSRSKDGPARAHGPNEFAGCSREEARVLLSQKLSAPERQALKADIHRFYNHGTDAARQALQARWGERLGVPAFDDPTIKLLLYAATDAPARQAQSDPVAEPHEQALVPLSSSRPTRAEATNETPAAGQLAQRRAGPPQVDAESHPAQAANDWAGRSRPQARLALAQKLSPDERRELKTDLHAYFNHGGEDTRLALQSKWGDRVGQHDLNDDTLKLLLFAATDGKTQAHTPDGPTAGSPAPTATATPTPTPSPTPKPKPSASAAPTLTSAAAFSNATAQPGHPAAPAPSAHAPATQPPPPPPPRVDGHPPSAAQGQPQPAAPSSEPPQAAHVASSSAAGAPGLQEPIQDAAISFEKQMELINRQQERMQIVSAKMELEAASRSMMLQALRDLVKDMKEAVKDAGEAGHKA